MIIPPYLKQGDTIGIVATARKISREEVEPAAKMLQNFGFRVKFASNLFSENNQFAGSDEERAADLMQMIDNTDVKAILCARGGYGTARILPHLDYSAIVRNPKWLCGYSDPTVLHLLYNKLGIASVHSTMPINFPKDGINNDSVQSLINALTGKSSQIEAKPHAQNIQGSTEGILIGGNLSLVYAMQRTEIEVKPTNKILFLEDLDEYLYHIDRIILNLRQSGVLKMLKGIVIGHMNDMHDNAVPFGKTAEEIIHEHTKDLQIPVAFNFPSGHLEPNMALLFGRMHKLDATQNGTRLVSL